MTETPSGFALTVRLDTSTNPPTIEVITDDPSINGEAVAATLLQRVTERLAGNMAAPTPFAGPGVGGGGQVDACELFTPEEVGGLLDIDMKLYGTVTPPSCGWQSDDLTRILPNASVNFESGALESILGTWPDAVPTERSGLPGYEYGYDVGGAVAAYLTLDLGEGLLTVHAISDIPDIDPADVVRVMADKILVAAGYTGS